MYKFGHLLQNEWHTMYELAKMFFHCVNHWRLETPSNHAKSISGSDANAVNVYREKELHKVKYTHIMCNI